MRLRNAQLRPTLAEAVSEALAGTVEEEVMTDSTVCEHGRLRRQCETCILAEEVQELNALVAQLDTLLQAGGINDLAFHIGQVTAILKRVQELEREVARLRSENQVRMDISCNACDEAFTAAMKPK